MSTLGRVRGFVHAGFLASVFLASGLVAAGGFGLDVAGAGRGPVEPEARPDDPAARGPRIELSELTHDFGTVSDSTEVYHEFTVYNRGDEPLVVGPLVTTCACTVPSIGAKKWLPNSELLRNVPPPEPETIAPGGSAVIRVSFNPLGRQDAEESKVTIRSNDPDRPGLDLTVTINVDPAVRIDPFVWNFGDVPRGETKVLTVVFTGSTEEFKATRATFTGDSMGVYKARAVSTETVDRGGRPVGRTTMEVTLDASGAKPGMFNGDGLVRLSGAPRATMKVSVLGRVVGDLSLSEFRFTLGAMSSGDRVERVVRVSSRTGRPFRVLGVREAAPGGLGARVVATPVADSGGAAYDLTLTYTAPARFGGVRGTIEVETDVPDEEHLKIAVFGTVEPGARPEGSGR